MYLLLANPKAGNQRYRRIERALTNLLNKLEIEHKIVLIDDLTNVGELLKRHVKPETTAVVAVGGNGTVNTLIDALADYDNLPLGIIPISRSNHLAQTLGIANWQAGVKLLVNHEIKKLRLGRIGERYFAGSLIISPKRNLIANIFERNNLLKNFIGANVKQAPKEEHQVACSLDVDNTTTLHCQLNTMTVYFQDDYGKKMKINLTTLSDSKPENSIFRANQININSSLNMPVICGNEVVANTPVKIQGVGKTLPVLTAIVAEKSSRRRV